MALALVATVAAMLPFALGAGGVDVSTLVLPDAFQCLVGQGMSFTIIRAFQVRCRADLRLCTPVPECHACCCGRALQSNGVPDTNSPHTLYNA
jgi:hypothetical protein